MVNTEINGYIKETERWLSKRYDIFFNEIGFDKIKHILYGAMTGMSPTGVDNIASNIGKKLKIYQEQKKNYGVANSRATANSWAQLAK